MKTPGQVAYEKWAEIGTALMREVDSATPLDFFNWESISDRAKESWEEIALAAIQCPAVGTAPIRPANDI